MILVFLSVNESNFLTESSGPGSTSPFNAVEFRVTLTGRMSSSESARFSVIVQSCRRHFRTIPQSSRLTFPSSLSPLFPPLFHLSFVGSTWKRRVGLSLKCAVFEVFCFPSIFVGASSVLTERVSKAPYRVSLAAPVNACLRGGWGYNSWWRPQRTSLSLFLSLYLSLSVSLSPFHILTSFSSLCPGSVPNSLTPSLLCVPCSLSPTFLTLTLFIFTVSQCFFLTVSVTREAIYLL